MNLLKHLNIVTCKLLQDISNQIDNFIYEKIDNCNVSNKKETKSSSELINEDAIAIIHNYPGFDNSESFYFPKRLGHMELEAVKVDSDDMFKLSELKIHNKITIDKNQSFLLNDPIIATSFNQKLDDRNSVIFLNMQDCFSFIQKFKFETNVGLSPIVAEEVLIQLVSRLTEETGWTFEQVLLAILMRDILMPTLVTSSAMNSNNLHDTLRLYYSLNGSCRWAVFPYHSPSIDIGDLVYPGDNKFPNEQFGIDENDF